MELILRCDWTPIASVRDGGYLAARDPLLYPARRTCPECHVINPLLSSEDGRILALILLGVSSDTQNIQPSITLSQ